MIMRLVPVVLTILSMAFAATTAAAQSAAPGAGDTRASTGGAQTLEDIIARQNGLKVNDNFRRDAIGADHTGAGEADQLGTLGGASDAEVFRALRYGLADVTVSPRGYNVIIQDSGMKWLEFRHGPLLRYGSYVVLGMLALLAMFYLLRGRIRIDGGKAGKTVLRFDGVERFGHWLVAGSFVVLALTGLTTLFGRLLLIPVIGKDGYGVIAMAGKWVHNNVAWAFMLGLVLVFVMWVLDNIPNRSDLRWLAQGGGLFSGHAHPPAPKFNAGQKIIFWLVMLLGTQISFTGVSLLFPFQLHLFAPLFDVVNHTGLPRLVGFGDLPTVLTPAAEMQLSQIMHASVAFLFIAIILAHIYLGTLGMEGAFDAMGSGQVDEEWAKQHHSLWYDELGEARATDPATQAPAE